MTARLKHATDSTLAVAFDRAGISRHKLEAQRLARLSLKHDNDIDGIAALDRVLRRAGAEVMIAAMGDEAWTRAVKALRDEMRAEADAAAAPRNRDGEGQRNIAAIDSQWSSAPPSRPHDGEDGHRASAAHDSQMTSATSPSHHRDGEGPGLFAASDSRTGHAPPSRPAPPPPRPLKTQAGLIAFQAQLANSLLSSYRVAGRPIGEYTVAEAIDLAKNRLAAIDREAHPFRVLRAAAQHAANAPGNMLIRDLCSDTDIARYITETSHAV